MEIRVKPMLLLALCTLFTNRKAVNWIILLPAKVIHSIYLLSTYYTAGSALGTEQNKGPQSPRTHILVIKREENNLESKALRPHSEPRKSY